MSNIILYRPRLSLSTSVSLSTRDPHPTLRVCAATCPEPVRYAHMRQVRARSHPRSGSHETVSECSSTPLVPAPPLSNRHSRKSTATVTKWPISASLSSACDWLPSACDPMHGIDADVHIKGGLTDRRQIGVRE